MGNSPQSYKLDPVKQDPAGEIIDLDAPEYREYIKVKRKSLSEGALNDISYLDWRRKSRETSSTAMRTPLRTAETAQNNNHEIAARRISAPVTGNERFLVAKKNGEACEKRSLQSKQRIEDIRKKYKLKDRDYNARSCLVWTEQDEKEKRKEKEQRRALREQIRFKYDLPAHQYRRTSMVASG